MFFSFSSYLAHVFSSFFSWVVLFPLLNILDTWLKNSYVPRTVCLCYFMLCSWWNEKSWTVWDIWVTLQFSRHVYWPAVSTYLLTEVCLTLIQEVVIRSHSAPLHWATRLFFQLIYELFSLLINTNKSAYHHVVTVAFLSHISFFCYFWVKVQGGKERCALKGQLWFIWVMQTHYVGVSSLTISFSLISVRMKCSHVACTSTFCQIRSNFRYKHKTRSHLQATCTDRKLEKSVFIITELTGDRHDFLRHSRYSGLSSVFISLGQGPNCDKRRAEGGGELL